MTSPSLPVTGSVRLLPKDGWGWGSVSPGPDRPQVIVLQSPHPRRLVCSQGTGLCFTGNFVKSRTPSTPRRLCSKTYLPGPMTCRGVDGCES